MNTKTSILASLFFTLFSNLPLANETFNNVLDDSDFNSLKSVAKRAIDKQDISTSDVVQLAGRSNFQVEETNESIDIYLSVDGNSVIINSERSDSDSNQITTSIRVANANYTIEFDSDNRGGVMHGYGSTLGVEGKILLYVTLAKMEENRWRESSSLSKSRLYRLINWLSEMPAGTTINTTKLGE
ncbi:hypothetical protein ACJJID_04780 [Microbulbifer sp. CnH-101-G]|uniref:hypothetical protein n=1 Tax=Microbulbifer sp. CnH-101-G TaxID=3243393 RepID=UPI00403A0BDE